MPTNETARYDSARCAVVTEPLHALPESQIVWYCDDCRIYTLERTAYCLMDCETEAGDSRKQRKRRVYICADCGEERHLYLSKQDFLDHNEEYPMNEGGTVLLPGPARSVTIEYIGTLPRALAKNKGNKSHWRYRQGETKNLREVGWGLILKAYGGLLNGTEDAPLFLKATILVTQHWCGKAMDVSGLASASAPLIDSFMDAGVIEDDGPAVVVETRYAHVRVPHRPGAKIVVTCTEVSA